VKSKKNQPAGINRRQFLHLSALATASLVLPFGLTACSKSEPGIRIASNVWPGYEFLYLARAKQYFSEEEVRMIEMPSASVCIEALAASTVEGACLTLDEVLTARAEGLDLTVVTILDISLGADVLLANPKIKTLQALKGHRVGVEQSAVGAVMLHAALEKAGLHSSDITIRHLNVNRHRDAYLNNEVDALVTFEPVVSQLAPGKPVTLFTSADIPGRIVDVIAVRPDVIKSSPTAVRKLVAGHFMALRDFMTAPQQVTPLMTQRLKIPAQEIPRAYHGIELPDAAANRKLLLNNLPDMEKNATELAGVMLKAKLLRKEISLAGLFNGQYLP